MNIWIYHNLTCGCLECLATINKAVRKFLVQDFGGMYILSFVMQVRWTIKKAECWRINAFQLWYWRRLLRVHWTARRSNQSILKDINPEYSLEGLMLKLKLQYFGYLMRSVDSLEKTLMLGKIEGRRRGDGSGWDGWMIIMDSIWVCHGAGVTKSPTWMSN